MSLRRLLTASALAALCVTLVLAAEEDWSASVKFPASEKPVKLFNGKDFDGWYGNTGEGGTQKYFSIKEGVIVARNEVDNAPKVSNYLLTKKTYRNFRLVFEAKLVESPMHSGVAFWGDQYDKDGEKNSYQGPPRHVSLRLGLLRPVRPQQHLQGRRPGEEGRQQGVEQDGNPRHRRPHSPGCKRAACRRLARSASPRRASQAPSACSTTATRYPRKFASAA